LKHPFIAQIPRAFWMCQEVFFPRKDKPSEFKKIPRIFLKVSPTTTPCAPRDRNIYLRIWHHLSHRLLKSFMYIVKYFSPIWHIWEYYPSPILLNFLATFQVPVFLCAILNLNAGVRFVRGWFLQPGWPAQSSRSFWLPKKWKQSSGYTGKLPILFPYHSHKKSLKIWEACMWWNKNHKHPHLIIHRWSCPCGAISHVPWREDTEIIHSSLSFCSPRHNAVLQDWLEVRRRRDMVSPL